MRWERGEERREIVDQSVKGVICLIQSGKEILYDYVCFFFLDKGWNL